MKKKNYKHESFGVIQIHKIFGKSGYMFGSDVTNNDSYLEMEISQAEMDDDPTTGLRSIFGRDRILRVKFTDSQLKLHCILCTFLLKSILFLATNTF